MLLRRQHGHYYPHFTDGKTTNLFSEVKEQQVRSRARPGVAADFLHYHHVPCPLWWEARSHMWKGGKWSHEGVKERLLGQEWGSGFQFWFSCNWASYLSLSKLPAFLAGQFLPIKQGPSALNSRTNPTPPWNDQADIRYGLVNLTVLGHSSLKLNEWGKCRWLIPVLKKMHV